MTAIDSVRQAASPAIGEREAQPQAGGASDGATTAPVRAFGRYQLLRLLGKSARSMAWLAIDPQTDQEVMLVLPRSQPVDGAAMQRWLDSARKAARIKHPGLAHAVEVGEQDRWPYVAYDRANGVTLAESLPAQGMPALDAARVGMAALEGLAFAHEAGVAHRDLQPFLLMVTEQGDARVMGLEVASQADAAAWPGADVPHSAAGLQAQRRAAERDVLAFGLILHHALCGQPALGQADVAQAIVLMPPAGREIVRLPWATARQVPEPLRAIVNRATDRQERQRYRNARTLARAVEGWIAAESGAGGGPLALLLDRLHSVGLLPSLRGAAATAARLAMMERERTIELAEIVLQDPALTFEMLRAVNTAQVRGAMVSGNGAVLTIRRAIAMIGLDGVRRAALALREWPGPLNAAGAHELERMIDRVKQAGRIAQALRPMGFDAELVYLVTLLQNLGRMVVQYHFPDEAGQIRRLMQPATPESPDDGEQPGMNEQAASFAVLGIDIEPLGQAVAKHWGFDEAVLQMIRRQVVDAPVHAPDSDDGLLRVTASCANELIDALALPAPKVATAMQRVAQRYARSLGVSLRDLQAAAQGQRAHGAEFADGEGDDDDDDNDDDDGRPASPGTAAP